MLVVSAPCTIAVQRVSGLPSAAYCSFPSVRRELAVTSLISSAPLRWVFALNESVFDTSSNSLASPRVSAKAAESTITTPSDVMLFPSVRVSDFSPFVIVLFSYVIPSSDAIYSALTYTLPSCLTGLGFSSVYSLTSTSLTLR